MNYNGLQTSYWQSQIARVGSLRDKIAATVPTQPGRVIPDDEDLAIGQGRRLKMAVLFLDISGFSKRLSETEDEQAMLLNVLNLFFTEMIKIAEEYGGTVEKNTGDGLMAPKYVDLNTKRSQRLTGKQATLEGESWRVAAPWWGQPKKEIQGAGVVVWSRPQGWAGSSRGLETTTPSNGSGWRQASVGRSPRNSASQGTLRLASPLSVPAGEWHDLADGGPLRPAALCGSGGEQRLPLARETARPGANWLRAPFPKAGREFRPPAEAEAAIGEGAGCGRGLGPHAPRVGGTVRSFCETGSP
jgi:hypothetical protein